MHWHDEGIFSFVGAIQYVCWIVESVLYQCYRNHSDGLWIAAKLERVSSLI